MENIQLLSAKDLPRFDTSAAARARTGLVEELSRPFDGDFRSRVSRMQRVFPSSVTPERLASCLASLPAEMEDTQRAFFITRLAGNVDALVRGSPVSLDPAAAPDGWCVFTIADVEKAPTRKRGMLERLILTTQLGPWAGSELSMVLTDKAAWILAVNIGCSRRVPALRLGKVRYLSGMELTGYVTSNSDTQRAPRVAPYGASARQLAQNRKLIRARAAEQCVKNYRKLVCDVCVHGRDVCPLATRDRSMVLKVCSACGREDWHDARHLNACAACRLQQAYIWMREAQQC